MLPELPLKLHMLMCSNNSLKKLPSIPESMRTLYCDENELTELPNMPRYLEILFCGKNYLRELPDLSHLEILHYLSCPCNLLQYLPNVPTSVTKFTWHDNPLHEDLLAVFEGKTTKQQIEALRKFNEPVLIWTV
jgi:Leucine-rich repeat (LRR) protein